MYKNKQLIVLMAGKGSRLYPLTLGFPKCLLSIKQKPAIYNMLIPLINNGLKDIIFVVNLENKVLIKDFMNNSFKNINLNITYVVQEDFSGPGKALEITQPYIKDNKGVILLLSDTLCKYPKSYNNSWIGVSKVKDDEKIIYCMIEEKNNIITKIIDKPKTKIDTKYAAIGLYFFKNAKLLKKVLTLPIKKKENEYQLSSYLDLYRNEEKLEIENITTWEDIGNLQTYITTNRNSFNCRNFNDLYLDKLGVIHKKSNYSKISSEIQWFKDIEKTDFEKLSPKFYDNLRLDFEYGIEYYDYLTLAEYNTFYPLTDYSRSFIFNSLLTKLMDIYKNNQQVSLIFSDLLKKMLIDKTKNRINDWERKDLVNLDNIIINDKKYFGIKKLLKELEPRINRLCNNSINYISIIHGDPAFTNILVSPRNMIFKFIDPRGNFGIDTIYGDYRYDLAKLRHCYHGNYDDIINDLFEVKEKDGIFKLLLYRDNNYKLYDEIMEKHEININDIELIEGLLFISMVPLHSDYPKRQLAFFIQGIKCLNNQLDKEDDYE
ncbi:MAG: hypothetical protein IJ572_01485 [Bacilli bacterium]|nr:hypothetical protein [Bacilli bacterium]